MRKIRVWKWNRNVLLGALVFSVVVAALVPTSSHTRAIENGTSGGIAAPRTSRTLVAYAPGDVHFPSLARLSRNGASVPELVMVAVLRGLGLQPVVVPLPSTRPEGTVLFTAPSSGVGVAPGSSVNIVVSGGKAVTVGIEPSGRA
jgi:hypothetical protein